MDKTLDAQQYIKKFENILPYISNKKSYSKIALILETIINHIKENYSHHPTELKIAATYVMVKLYKINPHHLVASLNKIIYEFFDYYYKNFDNHKNSLALISDDFIMMLQFYELFIKNYTKNNI